MHPAPVLAADHQSPPGQPLHIGDSLAMITAALPIELPSGSEVVRIVHAFRGSAWVTIVNRRGWDCSNVMAIADLVSIVTERVTASAPVEPGAVLVAA